MAIKHLGRFEILDEIGSGGMGVVYKGRDPKINRLVALKVVRPVIGLTKTTEQQQAVNRFHVEAQAAGQLSHPNIVTIYDVGEENTSEGTLVYIAMEYISGKGLDHFIAQKSFGTLEQKINVIKQIAEGLDYAHKKGVVHRDVKPANVIVTDEGVPKLTDFGLARLSDSSLTMSGTILGTPNYMSPEQVQGKKVDARSDFFSLTVVLYELITNEKPFAADSITSVIYKVVNEEPVPPRRLNANLPPIMDAFIRKGLAKNPDSRFQSGVEYIKGLNSILAGDDRNFDVLGDTTIVMDGRTPVTATGAPTTAVSKPGKGLYIGAGAGLAVVIALALIFSSGGKKEEEAVQVEPPAAPPAQVLMKAPEEPVTPAPTAPSAEVKPAAELEKATVSPAPEPKIEPKVEKKEEPAVKPATPPAAETKKEPKPDKKPVVPSKPSAPSKPEEGVKEPKKETKPAAVKAPAVMEEGLITITSEPSGAEVFIENKFMGLTPINALKHRQGELNLRVARQGYQTYTKKITLGEKGSFAVALLKSPETPSTATPAPSQEGGQAAAPSASAVGGLSIQAPPESVIYVDGHEYKETRLELKDLSPGTHLVYVQLKGKPPYTNRVNIKASETLKIDLR